MSTSPVGSAAAAVPDLTGYWRTVKVEGLDAFLKEAGYPWTMRRLAVDVASRATDIVHQRGSGWMRVTTVNARAAWTRTLVSGRETAQRDAEGRPVRTTAGWEAGVHKATHAAVDGGRVLESWRHADGGLMVVRSCLRVGADAAGGGGGAAAPPAGATVLWFLEAVAVPPTRALCGLAPPAPPVARDARRVARASDRDTAALQALARRKARWASPADTVLGRGGGGRASGAASPLSRSRSPPRRRTTQGSSEMEGGGRRVPGRPRDSTDSDAAAAVAAAAAASGAGGRLTPPPRRPGDPSPSGRLTPTPLEVVLAHRLSDFSENRSLTSVVPVGGGESALAAAAAQPELLDMSPDQAEATQLKLADLGRAVRRAAARRGAAEGGADVCGLCTVTLNAVTVPPYVRRAWEDL